MYRPEIKLKIQNFGPLARGTIHLRPFTVFAGPSNSGKSYLASLVHALHSFFAGSHRLGIMGPGLFQGRGLEALNYLLATREDFVSLGEASAVTRWAERTFVMGDELSQKNRSVQVSLPRHVVKHVNELFSALGQLFNREFAYCMGVTNVRQFRKVNSRRPTQLSVYAELPSTKVGILRV